MFVRETKGKTLEELDQVFAVPARTHAAYGLRQIPYGFRKFVLRQKVQAEELYAMSEDSLEGDHGKPMVEHKEKVMRSEGSLDDDHGKSTVEHKENVMRDV